MQVFNLRVATSLVVGNMIGAGIFTMLGLQLEQVQNPTAIIVLWLTGGTLAFCGAISYAKLAEWLPRSGGEYHFISSLYGRPLGFSAGLVSIVVGFAAPLALVASGFGHYFQRIYDVPPMLSGSFVLVLATVIHLRKASTGGEFHFAFTALKVLLILAFIVIGMCIRPSHELSWDEWRSIGNLATPGFALALIFTSFAYSGWNASCYILEELRQPRRNIRLSLLLGTGIVTALYLLFILTLLYSTPPDQLAGKIDVAFEAAKSIFGANGGRFAAVVITGALVSSVSALVVAGSRVYKVLAEDYRFFGIFAKENTGGSPSRAILLQSLLAFWMMVTFTFDTILTYTGFTLTLFSMLTVAGNFLIAWRNPQYKMTIGETIAAIIFLLANGCASVMLMYQQPLTTISSLSFTIAAFVLGKFLQKST